MVSIHSYAENALVTQVAETYNTNAYIGFYRNPPSSNPWGGVWTDGTALNFVYWRSAPVAQPDNYLGVEVCVNIFSSWSTDCSGLGGSYYSRRGLWNDVNPNGGICGVYAAVCEFKCTTAQFPIDDSCPFTTSQISIIGKSMTQSNFNSGFRALTKVNQADALEWAYTSSLLVFFHERNTIPNGNSVSYNIAPGEETTFTIKRNDYTRLDPPYGRCIHNKSEVKSFYSPGVYNIDSCFDSCYQDYVYETCDCMDPRFISESNVTLCNITLLDCFSNITAIRGEPSTWPECDCPQPCNETKYVVSWSKTVFRTTPTECNPNNKTTFTNCTAKYQDEYAIFNVYVPVHGHYVFVETPEYSFQDILNSFNNLTGLLLGISVVSFFEIISLFINISHVLCTKAPKNEQHTDHLLD
uniref:C-type lectin domain-containing protein n=1 Tax=Acrobeloides nanus TaxID=290746 RepID=A0A914DT89_9BILA